MARLPTPAVCTLLLCARLCAETPAAPPVGTLDSIRAMAMEGRIEHALRWVNQSLIMYPDDEELQQLKVRVTELYQRERGARADGTLLPPAALQVAPLDPATATRPAFGSDFAIPQTTMTMVWISPGSFLMRTIHGSDDDTPVSISRGYWLGRTEVTQQQWRDLRPQNPHPSYFKGSNRPVEGVSWDEAMHYAHVLTARERAAGRIPDGYEYRLPTEAEWEYACRAGTTGSYAGNLDALGWYEGNSRKQTHPVAQLQPNAWGFYDMHGNVWEWCLDSHAHYPGRPVVDPLQEIVDPAASTARVIRGGTALGNAGQCRSNFRSWRSLSSMAAGVGFRLALAPVRLPPATSTH